MSRTLNERRKEYYDLLERTQRHNGDITEWLAWFISILQQSILATLAQIQRTLEKTKYWVRFDQGGVRPEQAKVINRMLDGDFTSGINNRQYMSVAKVSRSSATRHLAELVAAGFMAETGDGGRSTRYVLNHHSD